MLRLLLLLLLSLPALYKRETEVQGGVAGPRPHSQRAGIRTQASPVPEPSSSPFSSVLSPSSLAAINIGICLTCCSRGPTLTQDTGQVQTPHPQWPPCCENFPPGKTEAPRSCCMVPKGAQRWAPLRLLTAAAPRASISWVTPQLTHNLPLSHTHMHARAHAHAHTHPPPPPSAPRWLRDICYCVSSSSRPDGGPAGRGLPGGSGREECAPAPRPIWPASRPICFPLPGAATAGPPAPARRGAKFMWPGLEPAVTGPHTLTQTHTGRPPPALMCAHTHNPSLHPPPKAPTFSHTN